MTALVVRRGLVLLYQAPDLGLWVAARADEVLPGVVQRVLIELDLCPGQLEVALESLLTEARDPPRLDRETGDRDRRVLCGPAQRLGEGQVDLVIGGMDRFLRQLSLLRVRGEGRERLGGLERGLIDERC
jgi:hypothetical protein